MIRGMSDQAYRELLLGFLPRPIATEADYRAMQQEIDHLLDEEELTSDEQITFSTCHMNSSSSRLG